MLSLATKFFLASKTYGIQRATSSTYQYIGNWIFDFRHGTNTAGWNELSELEISSQNLNAGSPYVPCKSGPLRRALRALKFPDQSVFVDFGCGKGKSLLVASEFFFARIVGIEFSAQLCKIANQNIECYRRKRPDFEAKVLHLDAAKYEFCGDENVLFFYDPFGPEVLTVVAENIRQSLRDHPRELSVIYCAPECREVFDNCDFLSLQNESVLGGAEYLTYFHMKTPSPADANASVISRETL